VTLRFLTAGESHGPELTAILEGLPAGLVLDRAALDAFLARRQAGFGTGGRMKIERDTVRISAGVMAGRTTGAPVALHLLNKDHANWSQREVPPLTVPRPGHADLSATVKYGYGDLRLALERASARETAARVAVGALCAQLLAVFDIHVGSYVIAIADVDAALPEPPDYPGRFAATEASAVRCPDPAATEGMVAAIRAAIADRDTLGGVFEVVALGLPPGLGSHVHWDRRLTGRLLAAIASVPAVKGAELGPAFENARLRGTAVHGGFGLDGERIRRLGQRAGGLEGGITTGEPIVLRGAMKPIATTLTPLPSVDLATGAASATDYERSDFCAVPRAAVVGEAMVAFVLADALLEKLGGDSLDELRPRFAALRQNRLADLPMDAAPWRFGYDESEGEAGAKS
jgi:chorismate synthase